MSCLSLISWNYRGVSSRASLRHLRELLRSNSPDNLILLETRCDSVVLEKIYKLSNLNHVVVSEARGFSGGIWVIWDSNKL